MKKIFITLLFVFTSQSFAQTSNHLDLLVDKVDAVIGERTILIVSVQNLLSNPDEELVLKSTWNNSPTRTFRLSERYSAAISPEVSLVGSHTWEVKAFKQNKAAALSIEQNIRDLQNKLSTYRGLLAQETHPDKIADLAAIIASHEASILTQKNSLELLRTLVETKQISVNGVAQLNNPIVFSTDRIQDVFVPGVWSQVFIDLNPALIVDHQYQELSVTAEFDSSVASITKMSDYSYQIDLWGSLLTVGDHSVDVNLWTIDKRKGLYVGQAVDAGLESVVALEDLRDSSDNSSLRQYYEKEIDDLKSIVGELLKLKKVHDTTKTLIATGQKTITVVASSQLAPPFGQVVSSYGNSACGISNQRLYCWGSNASGSIGLGSGISSVLVPTYVSALGTDVSSATLGYGFGCAIKSGALYCWGFNTYGVLGNGSTMTSYTPVIPSGMSYGVSKVEAGNQHVCALKGGTVYCWGNNTNGELGIGSTSAAYYPMYVSLPESAMDISVGAGFTCAVGFSGKIYCWGTNQYGVLGLGNGIVSTVPVRVPTIEYGTSTISAGSNHVCAVISGAARCWGQNYENQLGIGRNMPSSAVPLVVEGLASGVTHVSAGPTTSCAIQSGTAYCWGASSVSLGNGTKSSDTPVKVEGSSLRSTSISFRGGHGCFVHNGAIKCFGPNISGSLGNDTASFEEPIPIYTIHPNQL